MRLSRPLALGLVLATLTALTLGRTAHAEPAPAVPLSVTATLDQPLLVQGQTTSVHVLIELEAQDQAFTADDRPRINLAMVLDRSGSMQEKGKIGYLQQAAKMGVDLMASTDRLALIEYDDAVTVMRPLGPVRDKDAIKETIARLSPRGSTNLTGGMLAGVEQLSSAARSAGPSQVTRVMLLSDGLANTGVTDRLAIRARVREAREAGVRISTLGLGRDYDEDLMQMIAEQGGGSYYYIENPRQMVRIFENEMSSLFATVATNVTLAFAPAEGVRSAHPVSITDVYDDDGTIALADFYAGEKRSLILKISFDGPVSADQLEKALGTLSLETTNAETGAINTETIVLKATTTSRVAQAEAARNKRVIVEVALLEAEQKTKAALKAYEEGKLAEAQSILDDTEADLAANAFIADDARVAAKREALKIEEKDMAIYAAEPAAQASYLKRSKQRLYAAQKGDRKGFVLQQGAKGLEVERLQTELKAAGFYKGDVTGTFDPETEAALKAYQADRGLDADGVAGPATLKDLGMF